MEALDPEAVIEQAHAAEEAGDRKRALELYSRAIAQHPDNPDLYYFRGRCLFFLKRYSETIADLTQSLRLQPVFLSAYHFRALARYVTNDHRGAIDDYTEALKFDDIEPDFLARMFYARAMSHRALGETELAEQDFEAAKHHDPEGKLDPR
jgi:tetratricopeptide (TPR) repeat protein